MRAAPTVPRLRPTDLLRVGSVGLRTRRMRAALSATGIAIGIAAMVAVLGISGSSRASLLAQLDELGTNLLMVSPGQGIGGQKATLPQQAEDMITRIGPVQTVTAVGSVDAAVYRNDHIPEGETGGVTVVAARPSLLAALGGTMHSGRFLDAASERYPLVVLGWKTAEHLGVDRPGTRVWLGGRWFVMAGVMRPLTLDPQLDRNALIGYPVAGSLFGFDGSASTVYLRASPDAVEDVQGVLAATANPASPDEVAVSRPSDALEARAAASVAFTGLLLGLGAVALLVGGVGIANIMVISVLERRWEIGLRRALGATDGQIRSQFLCEALLLSAAGGIAGTLGGAALTALYATTQGWPIVLPPAALAGGVASALVIGALAGIYPATRAARLTPAEALRTV